MAGANAIVACIATVLGFATSAMVAEVGGASVEPVQVRAIQIRAQFRPIVSGEAPSLMSTEGPDWKSSLAPHAEALAARSFVAVSRTAGIMR